VLLCIVYNVKHKRQSGFRQSKAVFVLDDESPRT